MRTIAIRRSTRCVHETRGVIARPLRKIFREFKVVAHEERGIAFGRGRTRAHVQHQIERPKRRSFQASEEFVGVEVIFELERYASTSAPDTVW